MQKLKEQKHKDNSAVEILEKEGSLAIEELLQLNQQKFIEETLEVEVEEYLGRKRYEHSESPKGYRNGSYPKKVMLPGSSITINKPHFRNVKEKFTSRILRGIAQLSDKLRMVALEMYVRGLSTRDIEATLREPNGKPMFSRSVISVLTKRLYEQYKEFQERDLSQFDIVYLFVDGVYESIRRYTNNQTLLCAWATCLPQAGMQRWKQAIYTSIGSRE
ncbi:MAG: transposase mutator type [Ignavibacteria bacterium]|nr:MAG: transposase mutator type [Ignavibacteria bacterium]KAF0156548.1 MAG: transposase mutator type [Ignavibacteria bacterium]